MNKIKLLTWTALGLLLLNIFLIFHILRHEGPRPRPNGQGPKNIIIQELHLDNEQIIAYDLLISDHEKSMQTALSNMKVLKNKLYVSLRSDAGVADPDSIISEISNVQKQIETIHFNHFLEIKKLCKPDQINYFNDLSHDIAKLFAPQDSK